MSALPPLAGSGCLSVRVHVGSFPADNGISSVGTNDPARWRHLLWFEGEVWAAELKSDVLSCVPTFEELKSHFDHYRASGQSPWRRVTLPARKEPR